MPKSNRSKSALQDVASFTSWSSSILQEGSDERPRGNATPSFDLRMRSMPLLDTSMGPRKSFVVLGDDRYKGVLNTEL